MNTLSLKIVFCISLMMLFGQQTAFADHRPHSHRDTRNNHWRAVPAPDNSQFGHRSDRRRPSYRPYYQPGYRANPPPSYRPYYQPGYRVNPLPYGHTRIFVNNTEFFFSNGYFYRSSRGGYAIVEAPIGAIVLTLPRLHQSVNWRGRPYYIVGDTYYRRHPRGYIVVPNPGFGYRR